MSKHKRKFTWLILLLGAIVVGLVYGVYSTYRLPLDQLSAYAVLKDHPAWSRSVATFRLDRVAACPVDMFAPTTPLGFMVAIMDSPDADRERAESLFRHFMKAGCDINAADKTGLRPIHAAILFRNVSVVSFLLEHGADPKLKTEGSTKGSGKNGLQYAQYVCQRAKDKCVELRDALKKPKSSASPT
jgi:hypothetical protein